MWSGTTTELRDKVEQWISIEGILQSGTDPDPNRCEAYEFILNFSRSTASYPVQCFGRFRLVGIIRSWKFFCIIHTFIMKLVCYMMPMHELSGESQHIHEKNVDAKEWPNELKVFDKPTRET